ncbi:hypothetical protein ACVWVY_006062 [Bradyrhizobium sp. URHC0002]
MIILLALLVLVTMTAGASAQQQRTYFDARGNFSTHEAI